MDPVEDVEPDEEYAAAEPDGEYAAVEPDEVPAGGILILAATPLGNRGDASERLRQALGAADVIAAEDTRRTRTLMRGLNITPTGTVVSNFEHNEAERTEELVGAVQAGKTVLVVSDAGMPAVSDPGYRVMAAGIAAGVPVTVLPGPSAVTTALALSGIATDRFAFDGFAPRKAGKRQEWLSALRDERRTIVFFESPHRLADCLADAVAVLGPDRAGAVCRELTKKFEEVKRGSLAELAAWAGKGVRGEITVVLAAAVEPETPGWAELVAEVGRTVDAGSKLRQAAALVAKRWGVSTRELYQAAVDARG